MCAAAACCTHAHGRPSKWLTWSCDWRWGFAGLCTTASRFPACKETAAANCNQHTAFVRTNHACQVFLPPEPLLFWRSHHNAVSGTACTPRHSVYLAHVQGPASTGCVGCQHACHLCCSAAAAGCVGLHTHRGDQLRLLVLGAWGLQQGSLPVPGTASDRGELGCRLFPTLHMPCSTVDAVDSPVDPSGLTLHSGCK